ncbi:MAG: hypothetical protein CMJ78_21890 [Planctomycetaceae bacterium]|nr:hypothetical protein [Planctomycetaceae bacterium]
MSTARQFRTHYTYKDYCQWEGDWELWYGTAVAMVPSPFAPHERFISSIIRQLWDQLDAGNCQCEVYTNLDWVVTDDTVICPDVMIVCGDQPAEHLKAPPSFVVEVLSPSTKSRDRNEKFTLYEENGVKYYLMADLESKSLDVYELKTSRYEKIAEILNHEFELHSGCTITIDLGRLVWT